MKGDHKIKLTALLIAVSLNANAEFKAVIHNSVLNGFETIPADDLVGEELYKVTNFKEISTSYFGAYAIDDDGQLWSLGGVPSEDSLKFNDPEKEGFWAKVPKSVFNNKKIVQVSVSNSAMALDEDNNVWVVGDDTMGPVGTGTRTNIPNWTMLDKSLIGNRQVKSINSGGDHSVILDTTGEIWVTGRSQQGQLGIDTSSLCGPDDLVYGDCYLYQWHKIDKSTFEGNKIKTVYIGSFLTEVMDEAGNLWASGDNDYGQLGLGYAYGAETFTKNTSSSLPNIASIDVKQNHAYSLDKNGDFWVVGYNYYGELGIGVRGPYYGKESWYKINKNSYFEGNSIIDYTTKSGGGVLLDNNGNLWVAGDIANSYLGLGDERTGDYVYPWEKIDASYFGDAVIKRVFASNDTIYLLDNKGEFWSVGANSHGQLNGTSDKYYIDKFQQFDIIDYWKDTDNDGVSDYDEIENGSNPNLDTDLPPDTDGDGVLNHLDEDDDGDGASDKDELKYGTDPLDKNDSPLIIKHSATNETYNLTGKGVYYDDGGANGKYAHNLNSLVTINAPSGYEVKIKVETASFNTGDTLKIYSDGIESNLLVEMQKNRNYVGNEYVSTSGSMTFRFVSNNSKKKDGWEFELSIEKK